MVNHYKKCANQLSHIIWNIPSELLGGDAGSGGVVLDLIVTDYT